ncbi:MAG: metal-dependent transcriptional regulator [Clostridia bacterium]|nr:metal-dependent transcriptional regulator [Clostridia bacterium]MBO7157440.1 metal-dependent transcriptional regulator [Clostridia bacterium]
MQLQESGEMYLETILTLTKRGIPFRSIDVCEEMGYSKPSVSRAMGLLRKGEFIAVDKSGYISLTDVGREAAEKIFARHTLLTTLLQKLGVDSETAAEDACKMEHVISDTTFQAIKEYLEK